MGGGYFEEVGNRFCVGGRIRNIFVYLDGFFVCFYRRGFFIFAVGVLGLGDRKCDLGGYENSFMCFVFLLL